MNAVRSPEDIMPAIPPAGAAAPRVNPLQRIWLREIGMEKLWLKPAPAARQVDAQVVDLKKEASVRPARVERVRTRPRRSRCLRAAGAGRAGPEAPARVAPAVQRPAARRSPQEPEVAEAPVIPSPSACATPPWTNCASRSCPAPPAACARTPPRGSAMAASRRAGWWWARRRANRKTARASPSSAFGPAARRHAVGRHEPRARRVHRQRDRAARPATAIPSPRKSPPAAPT